MADPIVGPAEMAKRLLEALGLGDMRGIVKLQLVVESGEVPKLTIVRAVTQAQAASVQEVLSEWRCVPAPNGRPFEPDLLEGLRALRDETEAQRRALERLATAEPVRPAVAGLMEVLRESCDPDKSAEGLDLLRAIACELSRVASVLSRWDEDGTPGERAS